MTEQSIIRAGQRFGTWLALENVERATTTFYGRRVSTQAQCQCSGCGVVRMLLVRTLLYASPPSCGCSDSSVTRTRPAERIISQIAALPGDCRCVWVVPRMGVAELRSIHSLCRYHTGIARMK